MIKVLMIGRSRMYPPELEKFCDEISLYVLEEAEIIEHLEKEDLPSLKIIKEIRPGAYQQSTEVVKIAEEWNREVNFDVVLPGFEYAVKAASLVAEILGLPYLGEKAVEHLTNKLKLRQLCVDSAIGHPNFREIKSEEDIISFFQEGNQQPIVIKPANRQASAGVIKVEKETDIPGFYQEMTGVDEGNLVIKGRDLKWEYLAEGYLSGYEISIESFIKDGNAIFHNITGKRTNENSSSYFVEIGHTVPAQLKPEDKETFIASQNKLINALKAETGFIHAEWKVDAEGPKLIECAGRGAGDSILTLIKYAYDFNPYKTMIELLAGKELTLPQNNTQAASIHFFQAKEGTLTEIEGKESLENNGNIVKWDITVKPGDSISAFNSSWKRIGYFIVTAKDYSELDEISGTILSQVNFIVQ